MFATMKDSKRSNIVQLGYLLGRIHSSIRKNASALAEKEGVQIPFTHMIILRILKKGGGEVLQSELLDCLPIFDKPRLSRACNDLESEGFIAKKSNPKNRRENLLFLTQEGINKTLEFESLVERANPHLFDQIPEEEVQKFFDILNHITINLDELQQTHP